MESPFEEWYLEYLEKEVTDTLHELPIDKSVIEMWIKKAWEAGCFSMTIDWG